MYYCIDCPLWKAISHQEYLLGFCPHYQCTIEPDEGACEYGLISIEVFIIEEAKEKNAILW